MLGQAGDLQEVVLLLRDVTDRLEAERILRSREETFSRFLDSSLDRLSDMVIFVGLMVFYARDTEYHSTLNVFLAGAALTAAAGVVALVLYAAGKIDGGKTTAP